METMTITAAIESWSATFMNAMFKPKRCGGETIFKIANGMEDCTAAPSPKNANTNNVAWGEFFV